MFAAVMQHWPEYAIEGALLGGFMVSACLFGALLEHPAGLGRRRIASAFLRRAMMGGVMGVTAVGLIYSPWGQRSGAHMNPATTLTFLLLGKVAREDALFYVLLQFAGAAVGVALCRLVLRDGLTHAAVNCVITEPGPRGRGVAWAAEFAISFAMMLTVLIVNNDARLTAYTGWFAGGLVALYITFAAPLSGMSLNPARTFGSAIVARRWRAFWVYLTAPIVGMVMAAGAYGVLPGHPRVYCAKLDHGTDQRCIFDCEFHHCRSAANLHSETSAH